MVIGLAVGQLCAEAPTPAATVQSPNRIAAIARNAFVIVPVSSMPNIQTRNTSGL